MLAIQLVMASAIGVALVAACRWVRRRSPLCAAVVVAGLLLRAAVTLILFWTSYLNLPVLRQQHSGDGFWKLAVDAGLYYRLASSAAHFGLDTVPRGSASPAFVKALALWMRAVGSSPMSGGYLNLTLYVLLCLATVATFRPSREWRTALPCAVMLAAMAFSPVLVAYSSQPLKDAMFVFLIGVICVATYEFLPWLIATGGMVRRSRAAGVGMAAIFVAALYVIAGIRAYYAALAWSALALVLLVCAWQPGRGRIVRYASWSILLLAGAWLSYMRGADVDYINPYSKVIAAAPGSVLTMFDSYRAGFVLTPGATNVQSPGPLSGPSSVARDSPRPTGRDADRLAPSAAVKQVPDTVAGRMPVEDSEPSPIARRTGFSAGGVTGRLSALAVGLGLMFVPVSVLRALSIVDFTGGRGLLILTDVDTLFMDLTIVVVIALLVRRRSAIADRWPYVGFAAALALVTALLMAYIVTNFGTLFRLRLMVGAPLWMLPLALSSRVMRRPPDDEVARLAARTRASFGYEWTHFNQWDDSGEINFRDYFETADLEALRSARVLDAGCGMGRHARQMAAHARHVIALDFSRAVEQAAINTREVGNVDCVQADLLRLPFPDATFDYVYSLGVLHHLANTETAVRALVATLKPGGRLRVYLYWKRHGGVGAVLRIVNAVRLVTTRLPFWLLRWLCWILSAGLWLAVILPYRQLLRAGVRGIVRWPLFVYARYPFRVLYNDQFDRFSAPLEKRYDPDEVVALLESAGLRDVRVSSCFGWIAEGVKPAGQSPCAG